MAKFNVKDNKAKENKLWNDTIGAIFRILKNWLRLLYKSYRNMGEDERSELISKICWLLTVGAVTWVWCIIYPLFYPLVRLFAIPASIGFAYFFGKKFVPLIMVERFGTPLNNWCDKHLNDDE